MSVREAFLRWPRLSLIVIFICWKCLLFAIALYSPGPGYDTSTTILHPLHNGWAMPFIRWDAVYFTQIAQRGYLFEQDWAFSWGLTRLMHVGAGYIRSGHFAELVLAEAWSGIIIAHVAHFIAVQALYSLAIKLFRTAPQASTVAYAAACLHIFSPAGLFLSAPYAESIFAALQFLGYNAYIDAWLNPGSSTAVSSARLLVSGLCFGLAMLMRSNGLFSGILFAYDAVYMGVQVLSGRSSISALTRLIATIFAGLCIALGAAWPQILAYQKYCLTESEQVAVRPWCTRLVPSIYTFVQAHYWNVGFLRYWTLSNLPLFLLAAPTWYILGQSSYWAWTEAAGIFAASSGKAATAASSEEAVKDPLQLLQLLAVPQAVLILMTLLNSHVQIVTRLASGYPLWYIWLAAALHRQPGKQPRKLPRYLTRWMVVYALIQAGLFASFLPPA